MQRFGVCWTAMPSIVDRLAVLLAAVLLAAAMLSMADAAHAQQAMPDLLTYPDTSLNGVPTAALSISQYDCQTMCSQRSGCAGFDYDPSANQCRLFATVSSARSQYGWSAAARNRIPGYQDPTNLPQEQEPTPVPVAKTFTRYPHRDLGGYDIADAPSDNIDQCENFCIGTQGCTAYTFNAWNRKCFLKNGSSPLRLEPRATTGILSELPFPGERQATIVMEYYGNYVMSGNEIGEYNNVRGRDQCENLCWNDSRCAAFSFVRGRALCALFDDPRDRLPRAGIQSGAKIQPRP